MALGKDRSTGASQAREVVVAAETCRSRRVPSRRSSPFRSCAGAAARHARDARHLRRRPEPLWAPEGGCLGCVRGRRMEAAQDFQSHAARPFGIQFPQPGKPPDPIRDRFHLATPMPLLGRWATQSLDGPLSAAMRHDCSVGADARLHSSGGAFSVSGDSITDRRPYHVHALTRQCAKGDLCRVARECDAARMAGAPFSASTSWLLTDQRD